MRRRFLGELMRQQRARLGYTLDDAAALSGLAKSTLWEVESATQVDPKLSTILAICGTYRIQLNEIARTMPVSRHGATPRLGKLAARRATKAGNKAAAFDQGRPFASPVPVHASAHHATALHAPAANFKE